MSPLERFPQEQTDAPSDSGALRLNLSGGGLCWRLPFCRAELHRALSAMLRAAGSGPAELDLVLVRDAGMADYNLRYMGCHGPTNVLSFPIDEQIAGADGLCSVLLLDERLAVALQSNFNCHCHNPQNGPEAAPHPCTFGLRRIYFAECSCGIVRCQPDFSHSIVPNLQGQVNAKQK